MKDKIYSVFSAIVVSLLILLMSVARVALVYAQNEDSPAKASQTLHCLQSSVEDARRQMVRITGGGIPTDQSVYIMGCVQTGSNFQCTTGNNQYDEELNLGTNNFTRLQTSSERPLPYKIFDVPGGSKQTFPSGTIDLVVKSTTRGNTNHAFWAVYFTEFQGDETDITNTGTQSSLQYATIELARDGSTCTTVRQDPYGTLFDADSLEPLPDTTVTLLDENGGTVNQVGVPNPVQTVADGVFNFVVDPGSYTLQTQRPSCSITTEPHPNFFKAYSQIYTPGEVIVETADAPEHRDIALKCTTPYRADPESMSYGVVQLGQQTRIEGKVSHPLTTVELLQNELVISSTEADRNGFYRISVSNDQIASDQTLALRFLKKDLTVDLQGMVHDVLAAFGLVSRVSAQALTSKVTFDPILRYVEGYAYDGSGNAVPLARIVVKLEMSDEAYFETTADEQGFFVIAPQNLPIFNYYLEFTKPNSLTPIKQTTVNFATANKNYLTENNIDLVAATVDGVPLLPTATPQPPDGTQTDTTDQVTDEQEAQPGGIVGSVVGRANMVSVVAALFVLIALILLLIKIKRQKGMMQPTPPPPPTGTPPVTGPEAPTVGEAADTQPQVKSTEQSNPPDQPLKPELT